MFFIRSIIIANLFLTAGLKSSTPGGIFCRAYHHARHSTGHELAHRASIWKLVRRGRKACRNAKNWCVLKGFTTLLKLVLSVDISPPGHSAFVSLATLSPPFIPPELQQRTAFLSNSLNYPKLFQNYQHNLIPRPRILVWERD